MDPLELRALLAPLIAGEADYAKGNRLDWPAGSQGMPWHRWLGNHLFSSLTRRAIGLDAQDSQCGYAAMNRRTQQALDWERLWKGYGYPNDLLSWLTVCGLRVRGFEGTRTGRLSQRRRHGFQGPSQLLAHTHQTTAFASCVGSPATAHKRPLALGLSLALISLLCFVPCGCGSRSKGLHPRSSRLGKQAGRRIDEEASNRA